MLCYKPADPEHRSGTWIRNMNKSGSGDGLRECEKVKGGRTVWELLRPWSLHVDASRRQPGTAHMKRPIRNIDPEHGSGTWTITWEISIFYMQNKGFYV